VCPLDHLVMAMGTVEQVLWPDALPDANLPRVAFYDTPNRGMIRRIYSPVMLAQSAGLRAFDNPYQKQIKTIKCKTEIHIISSGIHI
jgi:hypothetical protein